MLLLQERAGVNSKSCVEAENSGEGPPKNVENSAVKRAAAGGAAAAAAAFRVLLAGSPM